MEQQKKLALLRRTPLLSALSETSLRALLGASQETALAKGEIVFEEGEPGRSMYVVLQGKVVIYKQGKRIAVGNPGDYFGEMALIDQSPRSATVVATEDSEIIPIDERLFVILVQDAPYFALDVMRTLVDRIRAMNRRM